MDKYTELINKGLEEIEKDTSIDKDIRDYSDYIAQKLTNCFGTNVVNEYIVNEHGEEKPYMFVLLDDVDRSNGTPILVLQVSDIQKVQEIAIYNMSGECFKPAVYTPAMYTAPNNGENSKLDIVQTLVSTAVAKIKGRFKIEVLEEEDTINVKKER